MYLIYKDDAIVAGRMRKAKALNFAWCCAENLSSQHMVYVSQVPSSDFDGPMYGGCDAVRGRADAAPEKSDLRELLETAGTPQAVTFAQLREPATARPKPTIGCRRKSERRNGCDTRFCAVGDALPEMRRQLTVSDRRAA